MFWKKIKSKESEWSFDPKELSPRKRKKGISGFMRLRNEEDFVAQAIESHLPYLDELILVYNRCTDKTPEICEAYANKFPEKVRAYHYRPHVYAQGTKEHKTLLPDSPNSLVNYYNYALKKTTFSVAVKIDGDHVAIPDEFSRTCKRINNKKLNEFITFFGVNLWDQGGEIYVNGNRPLTSGSDTGFFPVSKSTYFKHHPTFEIFSHKLRKRKEGILFFHLKSMKKDRGLGVYDLEDNPGSDYFRYIKMFYDAPELIDWEEYIVQEKMARQISAPQLLGIKPLKRID